MTYEEKIKRIKEIHESRKAWLGTDEYFNGEFNGIETVLAILEERDPFRYLTDPKIIS